MPITADSKVSQTAHIDPMAVVGYVHPKSGEQPAAIDDGVVVEPFAVIYKSARIGKNSRISTAANICPGVVTGSNFFAGNGASIREDVVVGNNVAVGTNSVILPGAKLCDNVKVHSLVEVAEYTLLDEGAWLGPGVLMFNSKYPKRDDCEEKERLDREEAPRIGKYAIIGGGAIINPGVVVGDYAIVASGTHLPPHTRVPDLHLAREKNGILVMTPLRDCPQIVEKYKRLREALQVTQ